MTQQPQPPDRVGLILGNVRLSRVLGQGGMGTVYLAEHVVLKTPYAVKVLHPELSRDAVLNERFRREAIVCSKLRHPNVVFLTDFGYHENIGLYIVMEYLEGISLFNKMQQGMLELDRVIEIGKQVCAGLQAAHEHHILHRDLKPENIFLVQSTSTRPLVKVLDFGIARVTDNEGPRLTEKGMVMGTPEYLAPEHIQGGRKVGPAADLYSLGLILFEMLTHRLPFDGGEPMQIFYQHVVAEPKTVSFYRPELANSLLEQLIQQMLAKLPQERPASAREVEERLTAALLELKKRGLLHATSFVNDSELPPLESTVTPTREERLSGIVQLLQHPTQQTKLTQFFRILPNLSNLPPDLFFSASWGLFMQDLRDSTPDSDMFAETLLQLTKVLDDFLTDRPDSPDQKLQRLVEQGVRDLFKLLDHERQQHVLVALKQMKSFPALQSLITPKEEGSSWSLKEILHRDVRDLFRSRKE